MNQITAILYFSRTVHAEASAKSLILNNSKSERFAAFFIQKNLKIALDSGLPVFQITEKEQRGSTFGERLANAFEDVFNRGFQNVIAIGNDCLGLTTIELINASKALQTTPSVLGATERGGTYLIGLNKNVFDRNIFSDINWQTPTTFHELLYYVESQNVQHAILSTKTDINSFSDWQKILPRLSIYLRNQVLSLFKIGEKTISYYVSPIFDSDRCKLSVGLRAPPCII